MAYAFVNQQDGLVVGTNQTSVSLSTPISLTAGNLLVWAIPCQGPNAAADTNPCTFSDSLGLTFVQVMDDGSGTWLFMGYAKITASGSESITATFGGGGTASYPILYVAQYSGLDTTTPFTTGERNIKMNNGPGTGIDAISSDFTPTLAAQPALVFGIVYDSSTDVAADAGTGFTPRTPFGKYDGTNPTCRAADKPVTSTTAVQATFTATVGADNYIAGVMVFKEAVGGGPPPTVHVGRRVFVMP